MDVRTFRLDLFHGDPVRLPVGEQGPRHRDDATGFFTRLVSEDRIRRDQVQGIHHPAAGQGIVEFADERCGLLRRYFLLRFCHRIRPHTRRPHTLPPEFP